MKTNKMTRVSSSDVLDITMPESWAQVDEEWFKHFCTISSTDLIDAGMVTTLLFLRMAAIRPIGNFGVANVAVMHRKRLMWLKSSHLALAISKLDFLIKPDADLFTNKKVREYLDKFCDIDIMRWKFAEFLAVDSIYSTLIQLDYASKQFASALDKFTAAFYCRPRRKFHIANPHKFAAFFFFAACKDYIAKKFTYLFDPTAGGGNILASPLTVSESVNAQIRALTKGDVTAEQRVLAIHTVRALTELNELAREYKEIKALEAKHK